MGRFKKEVNRRTSSEHRDAGEGDQARWAKCFCFSFCVLDGNIWILSELVYFSISSYRKWSVIGHPNSVLLTSIKCSLWKLISNWWLLLMTIASYLQIWCKVSRTRLSRVVNKTSWWELFIIHFKIRYLVTSRGGETIMYIFFPGYDPSIVTTGETEWAGQDSLIQPQHYIALVGVLFKLNKSIIGRPLALSLFLF